MGREVNESDLRAKLQDPSHSGDAIRSYFAVDPANPFTPRLVLQDDLTVVPDEEGPGFSAQASMLRLANNFVRRRRLQQYRNMVRDKPDTIRVVAEGDSWFQHPLVEDTLDHLCNHVAVYSIGAAGDELRNMFRENEYLPALKVQSARYLLLSGGGNDLLGPMFKNYIKDFAPGASSADLINVECSKKISDMENIYDVLLSRLSHELPDVRVLIHGYDYVIPRQGKEGRWIGGVLTARGVTAGPMQRTIVAELIDRFNESIASLAGRHRNLVYVDARKAVSETQWYDEIHPDSSGFQQVAIRFLRHLQ